MISTREEQLRSNVFASLKRYKEKLNIHKTYRLYGLTAMVQIFTNPTSTSVAACFNFSSRVASGSPARRANSR